MKINSKILSIPPYISTSWSNIAALRMNGDTLIVNLIDGEILKIANLEKDVIEQIFTAHAESIENEAKFLEESTAPFPGGGPFSIFQGMDENNSPFRIGFNSLDGLGSAMQHNPDQSNSPDLPQEMLEKISAISKIVTPDDMAMVPKPEPHCNCMHCQIARAIKEGMGNPVDEDLVEEKSIDVTEEDLQFQQWEIVQTGEKMFSVINRLDESEKYNVFLGHPVGCTCGNDGCEHILAVLKS